MNSKTSEEKISEKIKSIKTDLKGDLLILAHFYQNDDIVESADIVGDSLQLAREAAKRKDVKYIVVCGVSFMAEMVRILCEPDQIVISPEINAQCPMALMADIENVKMVWNSIASAQQRLIPVVYVNSTSELKAFCGAKGGTVCTSANASSIFKWVLTNDAKIFFFPDENLGRNTASMLGIKDSEIMLIDPSETKGGSEGAFLGNTKVVLWKGSCYVHTDFLLSQINDMRNQYKEIKIAVHPECTPKVCQHADIVGSTNLIKKTVENSPEGTIWAIGTEWNLVNRLKNENPDKLILPLKESRCRDMAMIDHSKLTEVLEGIYNKYPVGIVRIPGNIKENARIALNKMLEIE